MIDVVAALTWDPQVRGALIVFASVLILPGSVYLLLLTNLGSKVGFLVAMAGLTGWMAAMGLIWTVFGIGLRGEEPHWKVLEVVTGPLGQSTVEATESFPRGWEELQAGDPILGDAQAAADKVLAPAEDAGGHAEGEEELSTAVSIEPVFASLEDYTPVGGYRTGGENYFIPGGFLEVNSGPMEGWLHQPHYAIVQVSPVLERPDLGGAPALPAPDPDEPVTSVIMVRDLGTLRQKSGILTVSMTVLFGVICYVLHQRDLEIRRTREEATAART